MGQFHMGINMGHDRSVAVVENGKIVIAIEQERLDRIKHSVGFMLQAPEVMELVQVPGESIAYCLDHLGLPLSAMSTITANMPGEDMAPQIMRGKFSAELADRLRTVPSHQHPQPKTRISIIICFADNDLASCLEFAYEMDGVVYVGGSS